MSRDIRELAGGLLKDPLVVLGRIPSSRAARRALDAQDADVETGRRHNDPPPFIRVDHFDLADLAIGARKAPLCPELTHCRGRPVS
jgi:hypothetical protein